MRYIVLFVCLIISGASIAQNDANPAADILKSIELEVQSLDDIRYNFTLHINFPEQKPVIQKGSYLQKGLRYHLELPTLVSLSNGTDQWLIDKEAQEVQIHSFEETDKENIMNPTNLLSLYANPNFEYMLMGDGSGQAIQQIEFKPTDKYSEYSKARMTVDQTKNSIKRVEVFGKDGTQYDLVIDDTEGNTKPSDTVFQFDSDKYPGYHVEDLRIN